MKQFLQLTLVFVSFLLSFAAEDEQRDKILIVAVSQPEPTTIKQVESDAFKKLLQISPKSVEARAEETVDFNADTDLVLEIIARQMLMGDWDPAKLSDYDITFQYRPLLITYTGTLKLRKGFIQELSTVSRRDDAFMRYETPPVFVKVSIPLNFKYIIVGYDFEMNVRGDTVTGIVYAWASDVKSDYSIEVSFATMRPVEENFSSVIGSLDIDIRSVSISSSYRNLLTTLTTDVLRNAVIEETKVIFGGFLKDGVLTALGL